MTTYINSSIKALLRERRIPFDLVTEDYFTGQLILSKLAQAELEAADPSTKWLSHNDVFAPIRELFGYEV